MASSRIVEVGSSSFVQTKNKAKINFSRKAESEFFVDNSALAGFTGERILYMAIRELIENSLDSCEAERILPKIAVSLKLIDPVNDLWSISCEDNGIGIRSDKVSVAVCSFLTSGKYVEQQAARFVRRWPKNDRQRFLQKIRIIHFVYGQNQLKRPVNIISSYAPTLVPINQ